MIQGSRSMQLGGAGGWLLTTLMARMDGQASMPGGSLRNANEFRAARIAAEAASAQIVLGMPQHIPQEFQKRAIFATHAPSLARMMTCSASCNTQVRPNLEHM